MNKKLITDREQLFACASRGEVFGLSHLLLERGMSPDVQNRYGVTPLMEASKSGQLESVKILVQKGANVNAVDKEKTTVVMHACTGDSNSTIVEYLISHGARVNERDVFGCTALMRAASNGDPAILRVLIKSGAEVNAESKNHETPLTFAIVWNHPKVMEELIKAGADLNWKDDKDWTPLQYAVYAKNRKMVNLLQEYGAKNSTQPPNGKKVASKNSHPRVR